MEIGKITMLKDNENRNSKKTATKELSLETILFNCRNALRGAGSTEKKQRCSYRFSFY